VLAVSCFIFLGAASVTGIILGVNAAQHPHPPYATQSLDTITLNNLVPKLQSQYLEINSLEVEDYQFVTVKGLDNDGKEVYDYIDPGNGKAIGVHKEKSAFIQSVTSFHRSLFLHETGRFFIGFTSFLLVLIAVSGIVLVIKQQKGWKRFFASFSRTSFAQYYHIWLGRLSLLPIVILALSGTYLSLVKFNLLPEKKIALVAPKASEDKEQKNIADFASFQIIKLSNVRSIEFPFADDPDEYYKIKLKDREILVDQFDGKIVAAEKYALVNIWNTISLNIHTGKTNIVWAIVLTIASANILFFIYSGFVITFKRRKNKIKNKYKAVDAEYLLLVGSENGTTIHFANRILKQLLSHGIKAHVAELNDLQLYPNTQRIIVFAATFGLGDAPHNASKCLSLLEKLDSKKKVQYSIVGFGSSQYPDFCGFAKNIVSIMETKNWAVPILPLCTVDDKSLHDFTQWVKAFSDTIRVPLIMSENYYAITSKPKLYSFSVVEKTDVNPDDQNFILVLKPNTGKRFSSGDLLAIYPENNEKERLYSIGKINGTIQLIVKLHPNSLGSSFLYSLKKGDTLRAAIQTNSGFHFDYKNKGTIFVSNGTGIAPFLGMLTENVQKQQTLLYAGFRKNEPLQNIVSKQLSQLAAEQKLSRFSVAYSRENAPVHYVYEWIEQDVAIIQRILDNGGILMICGSIAMQKEVIGTLQQYCPNYNNYKNNNQIKSDCY